MRRFCCFNLASCALLAWARACILSRVYLLGVGLCTCGGAARAGLAKDKTIKVAMVQANGQGGGMAMP